MLATANFSPRLLAAPLACGRAGLGAVRSKTTDRTPGAKQRTSFWDKWEDSERGVQEFYKEVAFGHDLKNQSKWLPAAARKKSVRRRGAELEEEELEDEYFTDDLPSGRSFDPEKAKAAAAAQAAAHDQASENLLGANDVTPSRRAELMGLLDELGPEVFAKAPSPPEERAKAFAGGKDDEAAEGDHDDAQMREKRLAAIAQYPTYMSTVSARESGQIPLGNYFAYVLHTRRVAKRGPEGSRMSVSVLVVVGNGKGTAGLGLGKDLTAQVALMKATHAARKNLVHIDRFDDRTIFHDMEEFYGPTKLVFRMRRAHSGTKCNWLAWKIFSAFGLTDLSCQVHGSANNINQSRCIVNALMRMKTPQVIADARGKRVLDMTARGHDNPRQVLGPRNIA